MSSPVDDPTCQDWTPSSCSVQTVLTSTDRRAVGFWALMVHFLCLLVHTFIQSSHIFARCIFWDYVRTFVLPELSRAGTCAFLEAALTWRVVALAWTLAAQCDRKQRVAGPPVC
jgi:hypothetical protein